MKQFILFLVFFFIANLGLTINAQKLIQKPTDSIDKFLFESKTYNYPKKKKLVS